MTPTPDPREQAACEVRWVKEILGGDYCMTHSREIAYCKLNASEASLRESRARIAELEKALKNWCRCPNEDHWPSCTTSKALTGGSR